MEKLQKKQDKEEISIKTRAATMNIIEQFEKDRSKVTSQRQENTTIHPDTVRVNVKVREGTRENTAFEGV